MLRQVPYKIIVKILAQQMSYTTNRQHFTISKIYSTVPPLCFPPAVCKPFPVGLELTARWDVQKLCTAL